MTTNIFVFLLNFSLTADSWVHELMHVFLKIAENARYELRQRNAIFYYYCLYRWFSTYGILAVINTQIERIDCVSPNSMLQILNRATIFRLTALVLGVCYGVTITAYVCVRLVIECIHTFNSMVAGTDDIQKRIHLNFGVINLDYIEFIQKMQ